jgi:GT2 family glycosyltransferase
VVSPDPFVRVAIVNHNGGDLTLQCIASVKSSDWPLGRLEIVVVDNASIDGSAEAIKREHPDVRLVRASRNLGYAEATNLSLTNLEGVDYVALLNNDAEVGRSWLRPLVEALEGDSGLGAAVPKILFHPTFYELDIQTSASSTRLGDRRLLGIRLNGIRVRGQDFWTRVEFPAGWHYPEYDHHVSRPFRWSEPHARLLIPESKEGSLSVELLVAADREKTVALASADASQKLQVGPTPHWIELTLRGERRDVINSAGSRLVRGGYGADRGMLETDCGQYEHPSEVFAWSGCSVLLRPSYLFDVGLLEPRFFLYYEDLDLSWRGRARGWRYRYVPTAIVRHHHTSSTVEGSALFDHYVERNRLLVHARNAPAEYAVRVCGGFVLELGRQVRRDVVRPPLWRQPPRLVFVGRRLRSLGAFLWLLPSALRARRQLRQRQRVPNAELMRWLESPEHAVPLRDRCYGR